MIREILKRVKEDSDNENSEVAKCEKRTKRNVSVLKSDEDIEKYGIENYDH